MEHGQHDDHHYGRGCGLGFDTGHPDTAAQAVLDGRLCEAAREESLTEGVDKKLVTGEATGFNLSPLRRVLAAPAKTMETWLRRKLLAKLWQVLPTAEWLNQHGWKLAPFCGCGDRDQTHRLGACFLTVDSVIAEAESIGGTLGLLT